MVIVDNWRCIGINGKGYEHSARNRPYTLANWAIRNYWQ